MPSGKVTYATSNGVHVLRYHGRVDYMLAPAIRRFTDSVVAGGGITGWVFDLSEAEALDSTNLGLLARTAERSRAATGASSVIVSTNDDITAVLRSMSFEDMFEIVNERPSASIALATDIPGAAADSTELGQTMLEAHRSLVDMSEAGRMQFQDVVTCLEADLDK